jgi:tol-pal system protein YbgF
MSKTINRFMLSVFISATSVQVFANTAVPVTDLANDVGTQSVIISAAAQSPVVEPNKPVLSVNAANANAQMFDLVELLQRELQQLRGIVEELNHDLGRLKQDQKQRYLDLDRRIVSLSTQPKIVTQVPVAIETQAAAAVSQTPQTAATSTSLQGVDTASVQPVIEAQVEKDPELEKSAYKAAFGLIRERQYDASIVALLAFVKDFPQGELIANAHYWLGEVYMVQGDASLAAQSFDYVISEFPQHRKIPDALYKAGVAYQNVGNVDKANQMLQRVLMEYPDSSAARLALERVN